MRKKQEILKTIETYDSEYASKVIQKYTTLSEQEPQEWKHPFKLAFGHYFNKTPQKAMSSFEKALELDPNNIWVMGFVAYLHAEKESYKTALNICNQALKLERNATGIHFVIAFSRYKKGDVLGALNSYFSYSRLKSLDEQRFKKEDDAFYQSLEKESTSTENASISIDNRSITTDNTSISTENQTFPTQNQSK